MVLEKHSSASNHTSHTNNLEPPTPTDLNNDKHRTNTTNTTTSNSVMGQNSTTSAQPSVSSDFVFDESLFTAAFKLFDEKKIGRIYKSDLIKVLRAAGHNPSEKEIEEIHQSHHIKEGDMIQLEKAMKIAKSRPIDNVDKIIRAFKKFDRDSTGFISTEDMRTMMTSVGEKLTQQEVEELVEFADKNREGKVDYEEFARMIAPRPLTCLKLPPLATPLVPRTTTATVANAPTTTPHSQTNHSSSSKQHGSTSTNK